MGVFSHEVPLFRSLSKKEHSIGPPVLETNICHMGFHVSLGEGIGSKDFDKVTMGSNIAFLLCRAVTQTHADTKVPFQRAVLESRVLVGVQ